MNKWYLSGGANTDVAVSTRVRFARNLTGFPFPGRMSSSQREQVNGLVREAAMHLTGEFAGVFHYAEMKELSDLEAASLVEQHFISPEFAVNREGKALLMSEDETISIMLCEEDHIRIQVMSAGEDLQAVYEQAVRLDEALDQRLHFAFDERLGYLTGCPTNLGTGMRASVMLHLPALEQADALRQLANTLGKVGLTLRGTYGEGSDAKGALYQISNQITLGLTEQAAIENLQTVTHQIMDRERQARNQLKQNEAFVDKVWRCYGILKFARSLDSEEFLQYISWVRLGVKLSILKDVDMEKVGRLLVITQPATLQKICGGPLEPRERDQKRAEMVREALSCSNEME